MVAVAGSLRHTLDSGAMQRAPASRQEVDGGCVCAAGSQEPQCVTQEFEMSTERRALGKLSLAAALAPALILAAAGRAQPLAFDNSCGTHLWSTTCTSFTPPDVCVCSNNWDSGTVTTPECSACPSGPGVGRDVFVGDIYSDNDSFVTIRSLTTTTLFRNSAGIVVDTTAVYNGPVTARGYFSGAGTHIFFGSLTCETASPMVDFNWPTRATFHGNIDIPPHRRPGRLQRTDQPRDVYMERGRTDVRDRRGVWRRAAGDLPQSAGRSAARDGQLGDARDHRFGTP